MGLPSNVAGFEAPALTLRTNPNDPAAEVRLRSRMTSRLVKFPFDLRMLITLPVLITGSDALRF
jgi:hypothetical protein